MTMILVSGAIANKHHNGGASWTRLNWALGLKRLGFTVYFVEQISRESCVDPSGVITPFQDCVNLAYFKEVTEQFGLSGSAALIYENGAQTYGQSFGKLLDIAQAAEVLINITGHLTVEPLKSRPRCKVYIDLDPGFTQFWHTAGNSAAHLDGHDYYFTIGENIGTSDCPIPTGDICWQPARQPVVLEHWPVSERGDCDRFTTVASWRGPYGTVQYGGKIFGLKVHEFRKFIALPERLPQRFEIALDIHADDAKDWQALERHGWRLVDPKVVAADPVTFRRYVQTSAAEFSVAQGIYVESQCGWFSDRTVRYLASGKPALVQDTGFRRHYPVGEGLLTFRTLEEAVDGAKQIARDYDRHCLAARRLAEMYFDSDKVLSRMLDDIGLAR